MLKEEKIREISKSINEIREDIIDYRHIYQCTKMVFDVVFGTDTIFEGTPHSHLSVNIQKIVLELGMEVIYGNMPKIYKRKELAIHMYYYLKYYNDEKVTISSPLMPLKYDTKEDILLFLLKYYANYGKKIY